MKKQTKPEFLFVLSCETMELTQGDWPSKDADRLKALQAAVGGYVEIVRLAGGVIAWCDEDGIAKGLVPSCAVHQAGVPKDYPALFLRGNVAFVVRAASAEEARGSVEHAVTPLLTFRRKDLGRAPSSVQ